MEYSTEVLRRLQMVELEILIEIDRVCEEIGVSYFLDGGTLLGAIRHRGFIPWDDDIDIGMLRADYDKFLSEAPKHISNHYDICSPYNTRGYAPMFTKVIKKGTVFETSETRESGFAQGIFVDIFPYDYVSEDQSVAKNQKKKCRRIQTLSYLYHSGNVTVPHKGVIGLGEKLASKVAHQALRLFLKERKLVSDFEYWARMGSKGANMQVMTYAYPVTEEGLPKNAILPVKKAAFEGLPFSVPAAPEQLLEFYYGDSWNELPPPDMRKNHAPLRLEF